MLLLSPVLTITHAQPTILGLTGGTIAAIVLGSIGGLILLVLLGFAYQFFGLWLQALVSNARVGFIDLIMMKFRKVNAREIVFNRISAKKAGMDLPTQNLEAHYLAGGRVTNVVRAMIAADKAHIDLPWETSTAIDLAGRDILEAVRTSVDPKVIDCPSPTHGKTTIDAGRWRWHSVASQSSCNRTDKHRTAGRWCHRRDHCRACW